MKIADLYIRVSTDEQSDKGYSQRDQDERLRKYCDYHNLKIGQVIYEDHSAKTFNRPEWKKLLIRIKKQKGNQTDIILFTKWDRFSRNTSDAYQMISTLKKLGIEPQAIEQPLDMAIPESKIMLAIYLATPEVDNDRRALNVINGMRRAKKEGRFMGVAPKGYANKITEDGRKYIGLYEPEAKIMRWAFEKLAEGGYSQAEMLRTVNKQGLKTSRNNFWSALKNPVYCGKIYVPKNKDEEGYFVQGQHDPLISESLFNRVQEVITQKKPVHKTSIASLDELPLRGFLACPRCNKTLTGSPSKGRTKYYFYYHCNSICGYRISATMLNKAFLKDIEKYKPLAGMEDVYVSFIHYYYKERMSGKNDLRKQILSQITVLNKRTTKLRELLLNEELEAGDYRLMKFENEEKIKNLENDLMELATDRTNVPETVKQMINAALKIVYKYPEQTVSFQRKFVNAIYPQKLVFDNGTYRTTKTNPGIALIALINKELCRNKNGIELDFSSLSHQVIPLGFEPRTTTLKV
ncbi:recombinase family protein [Pedobacter sp. JCM 36344]|uniref:recombinase family protein n=1 Tax=Pedobacter sp. JCM 36344 TaxID=3374280 RepID=UPI00397A6F58